MSSVRRRRRRVAALSARWMHERRVRDGVDGNAVTAARSGTDDGARPSCRCSTGSRPPSPHPRLRRADEHGSHARSRARTRRAVPLSLRHGRSASAASAASSPATSRTAIRRRSTGGASARSKAAGFRDAAASYLSMGCNHCLEPTCLEGCPVDAYTKDPITGIVRHSADACIGCQYCTWNCSYGVPQYNPERGVVGKCDMCHGRLSTRPGAGVRQRLSGRRDRDRDRQRRRVARVGRRRAPPRSGLPAGDGSLSTTRITLPDDLPPNARPRDITHVTPEHPHWSLIVMTVLTQLSVGAFATIWLLQLLGVQHAPGYRGARVARCRRPGAGGRDVAPRAAGARLSRAAHVAALVAQSRGAAVRGVLARRGGLCRSAVAAAAGQRLGRRRSRSLLGLAGVTASACIYRVPARPAWNTRYTLLQFNLTAGDPRAAVRRGRRRRRDAAGWRSAAASMAGAQATVFALRFFRARRVRQPRAERHGAPAVHGARQPARAARRCCWRSARSRCRCWRPAWPMARAGCSCSSRCSSRSPREILGRYLFFVSVVPKHLAAPYIASASEAA